MYLVVNCIQSANHILYLFPPPGKFSWSRALKRSLGTKVCWLYGLVCWSWFMVGTRHRVRFDMRTSPRFRHQREMSLSSILFTTCQKSTKFIKSEFKSRRRPYVFLKLFKGDQGRFDAPAEVRVNEAISSQY